MGSVEGLVSPTKFQYLGQDFVLCLLSCNKSKKPSAIK